MPEPAGSVAPRAASGGRTHQQESEATREACRREQDDVAFERYLRGAVEPVADDFQVLARPGFVTVRGGVLLGVQDERERDLPRFDGLGRATAEPADEDMTARLAAARDGVLHADGAAVAVFGTPASSPEALAALMADAERRTFGRPGSCHVCGELRRMQEHSPGRHGCPGTSPFDAAEWNGLA